MSIPPSSKARPGLRIPHERYKLDNGLDVIFHRDASLPQVVVNLWYRVGSRDETPGRSGFAHLFEHLMFMGTDRVPTGTFDQMLESHGGWNNAWTSEDATDYYDVGPSNLLPLMLWLEADRMAGLGRAMTAEKLDLQREVVRNERRQHYEDEPYGGAWLALPGALYPDDHPYAHPVIGSHEDLEAATVDDVKDFFATWYAPDNASLVVAGDFDPELARDHIQRWFGPIPRARPPQRAGPRRLVCPSEPLVELRDQVQIPQTLLCWHAPSCFSPEDAELDLLAAILSTGRSSRLYRRLVYQGLAIEVQTHQMSQDLCSLFFVLAQPAEGHTLEEIEDVIHEEIARVAAEGPTEDELDRARNQYEMRFLKQLESLQARASSLNRYWNALGEPDSLAWDLGRYDAASVAGIAEAAGKLSRDRSATLRVRPAREGR